MKFELAGTAQQFALTGSEAGADSASEQEKLEATRTQNAYKSCIPRSSSSPAAYPDSSTFAHRVEEFNECRVSLPFASGFVFELWSLVRRNSYWDKFLQSNILRVSPFSNLLNKFSYDFILSG